MGEYTHKKSEHKPVSACKISQLLILQYSNNKRLHQVFFGI